MNELAALHLISYQILDGNKFHPELIPDSHQFGQTSHAAVFMKNFTEQTGGIASGKTGKINGRLCMANAPEYTSFHGPERKNMAGTREIVSLAGGIGQHFYCHGSVENRNARRHALGYGIDRNRKIGFMPGSISLNHGVKLQLPGTIHSDGDTEQSARLSGDKIHHFSCHVIGRGNEIAFVLTVFIIDYNDHPSLPDIVNSLIDRIEFHVIHIGNDTFFKTDCFNKTV